MNKIVLTSCGIIDNTLKEQFYRLLNKDIDQIKLLYITIAVDGEKDSDRTWLYEEYATILALGIKEKNITEYKYQEDIEFGDYDVIYMMGGYLIYYNNILFGGLYGGDNFFVKIVDSNRKYNMKEKIPYDGSKKLCIL